MSSLRDALLKAGKVSRSDAQRIATDLRKQRRRKKGHKLAEQAEAEQTARHAERVAAKREADKELERQRKLEFEAHERTVRIKNIIAHHRRTPRRRRTHAWHFVRSNDHIGFVLLDQALAAELEFGSAGIVEHPLDDTTPVVTREGVRKLLEFAPEVVRFYVGVDAPDDELVAPPPLTLLTARGATP